MARIARMAAPLSVLLLAGRLCAQETMTYSFQWNDNGNLNGNDNGILEPGEAARVWLAVSFTPSVGSTTTYNPPPPPGVGIVAGLDSAEFDLIASANAGGSWVLSGPGFNGVTGPNWGRRAGWVMGGAGDPGSPEGSLYHAATGTFLLPGSTASPLNPVEEIWRGKWTPTSYAARTVSFMSQDPVVHGTLGYSYLAIQFGNEPGTGHPLYLPKRVETRFYTSITIPIVPTPGCAVLLAPLAILASRRRRAPRA